MVTTSRLLKHALLLAMALVAAHGAQADTVNVPLQKFTASPALEMRCMSDTQSLSIPVPERWKVTKAVLTLRYVMSNNMLPDISQLTVKVNGELVSQFKMDALAPGAAKEIVIPADRLHSGYNTLTFQVAQHYSRTQCEQPCSPDLWTNISMTESSVHMDYELRPVPLKLGEVSGWTFDPKQFPEVTVNVVADAATPESVTMMGMVASGIARRLDYRKVKFSHSDDIKPGVDNVLVGSFAYVSGMLTRYGISLEPAEGGLIKVFYVPKKDGGKDGLHALYVITGKQPVELKIAAETFANMSLPYPGTDEMHALGFSMPDITMYSGREQLEPEKVYEFDTLGMSTVSFTGFNGRATTKGTGNPSSGITFRLPSDFLIKQNQYARVKLNFAYGAGLRADSALSIFLNDKQIRDIHLDSPSGNYIEGYQIDIPTYMFKPGSNTLSFRAYMNTPRQVCDASITDGLFVTVFGKSTMSFPQMPHFVEMPRADLFVLNGFPFTRWPDGAETLVYLPQHDNGSIDTALNLIGMVTQKNGYPLFGTQVVFAEPKDWKGEMLVVGETGAIPKTIMSLAPFQPGGAGTITYPVSRGWDTDVSLAISNQQAGLGEGTGLLMEFESGTKKGRSIVVATAQNENDLLALGDALLSPGVQARIKGDVTLVRLNVPEYDVASAQIGKKYSTGEKGNMSWVDAFLYSNPNVFYGLIAGAIIALSLLGFTMARRHRAKRLGEDRS